MHIINTILRPDSRTTDIYVDNNYVDSFTEEEMIKFKLNKNNIHEKLIIDKSFFKLVQPDTNNEEECYGIF